MKYFLNPVFLENCKIINREFSKESYELINFPSLDINRDVVKAGLLKVEDFCHDPQVKEFTTKEILGLISYSIRKTFLSCHYMTFVHDESDIKNEELVLDQNLPSIWRKKNLEIIFGKSFWLSKEVGFVSSAKFLDHENKFIEVNKNLEDVFDFNNCLFVVDFEMCKREIKN